MSGAVASLIDHTLLRADASRADVERLCEEALHHGFAAVCVNPIWVELCSSLLRGSPVRVCATVGFPLGATLPEVKALEAKAVVARGAHEVDMTLALGALKSGELAQVRRDLRGVVEVVGPGVPVKAILETGLLGNEEIVAAARLAQECGAAFVKTSTGFGPRGATTDDVRLLREVVGRDLGVKASAGIRTLEQARALIAAGASRLGTSTGVAIAEAERAEPRP